MTDSPTYQPAVALEFFKAGGTVENIPAGETIFKENKRSRRILLQRDKMYLLLKGEVRLLTGEKKIGTVRVGQIFGELAAIGNTPRSATAVAKTPCRVLSLDDKQFKQALTRKPAFALMLMGMLASRLRATLAHLRKTNALSEEAVIDESAVFNPKLLGDMVRGLADDPPVSFMRNQIILKEGQIGKRMYAVLEGRIAVNIGGNVVVRIGPGGVLGELALIDQSTRAATAVAEDIATLQPINREAFIELVKLDPALGVALLTALAERLRYLTGRLK